MRRRLTGVKMVSRVDVVVTGTGRSGTSTVSRILHGKLGICMGHGQLFHEKSEAQPEGTYEDGPLLRASTRLSGGFPFKNDTPSITSGEWLYVFDEQHQKCGSTFVGVKSPHLSGVTLEDWEAISPRLIIRTFRPKKPTVESMKRWRAALGPVNWGKFIDDRENNMNEVFPELDIPVYVVSFATKRTDYDLKIQLRKILEVGGMN